MPASLRGPDRLAAYSRAWGQPFFRAKTNEVGVSVACYGEVRPAAPRRLCGRSPRSIAWRPPLADHEATRAWVAALPGPTECPGLLAAARVMAAGLPGMQRGDRLSLPFPTSPPAVAPARLRPGLRAAVRGGAGLADLARQEGGDFDGGISTASQRRQSAAPANSIACWPPRAGSPNCPGARGRFFRRPPRSRCASRSSRDACSQAGSTSPCAPGSIWLRGWSRPACCAR